MNFFQKELIYVLILLLGSISLGLTIAYWSPSKSSMIDSLGFSDRIGTLFNFLAPFACIFGCPFINLFINKLGRNLLIFIIAVLMFITWIAMSYTQSNFSYLAFITRFLLGFEVGCFSTIIPIYISELIPNDINISYVIFHQFGISIGVLFCYIIGIWLKWRKISLISAIPAGLLSILIWLVPEPSKQEETNNTKETVFQKKYINQLFISILLLFFQQFAGTTSFLSNLNYIINKSEINMNSLIASFIIGLIGVIAVIFTYMLINFCGRKIIWYISSIGQAIVLVLAACNNKWKWSPIILIVCLIFDIFLFSIGLAPIPFLYLNELFDDSAKYSASSVLTAVNWCFVSVVFFLWDIMESEIGLTWSFSIFAIIMILSLIFGIFALPNQYGVDDTGNEKSHSKSQDVHSKLLDQNLL